jgi:hypothetical protein
MEVGQGPNWGCSAKEKKRLVSNKSCQEIFIGTHHPNTIPTLHKSLTDQIFLFKSCRAKVWVLYDMKYRSH